MFLRVLAIFLLYYEVKTVRLLKPKLLIILLFFMTLNTVSLMYMYVSESYTILSVKLPTSIIHSKNAASVCLVVVRFYTLCDRGIIIILQLVLLSDCKREQKSN